MDKRVFFILAMNAKKGLETAWVIKAFSLTEHSEELNHEFAPYEIVVHSSLANGKHYAYQDPTSGQFVILEDSDTKKPLFETLERIVVKPGEIANIDTETSMTYGQLLYNYTALVYPFGNKIPYSQIKNVEKIIADKLVGEETPEEDRKGKITVDEYLLFTESVLNLNSYTQLFTPAASRKSLTPPPWVKEFRDSLYKQYEGRLNDPAVVAAIDKALVEKYREYLSDDISKNFFIKDKQIALNNKKKYLMYGAEPSIDGSIKLDPIPESLAEGWNIEKFPAYVNTARSGSYNRGFNTRLGGEEFKWAVRNTINLTVTEDDCGSKFGIPYLVTESNAKQAEGCYEITPKGLNHITAENVKNYIGKTVYLRSPMYCKLKGNHRCAKCCGDKLALSKTGLSSAITAISSGIMYIFMSAAHAKGIKVARMTKDALI